MPEVCKIATLNFNGMATPPRMAMLEDFLQKQEIDIISLKEVTRPVFDDTRGFAVYANIDNSGRWTVILTQTIFNLRT
jgi:exonuclease III